MCGFHVMSPDVWLSRVCVAASEGAELKALDTKSLAEALRIVLLSRSVSP